LKSGLRKCGAAKVMDSRQPCGVSTRCASDSTVATRARTSGSGFHGSLLSTIKQSMEPFSMTTSKLAASKGSDSMSATAHVMAPQPLARARSRILATTVGEVSVEQMFFSPDRRYMSARVVRAACQRECE
jgi:hypothetical protein